MPARREPRDGLIEPNVPASTSAGCGSGSERSAVTKAVHVDVGHVQSFCIGANGDIILPTADDELLILDAVTLQLKRTIPVAGGMDIQIIVYLQSLQMYLA